MLTAVLLIVLLSVVGYLLISNRALGTEVAELRAKQLTFTNTTAELQAGVARLQDAEALQDGLVRNLVDSMAEIHVERVNNSTKVAAPAVTTQSFEEPITVTVRPTKRGKKNKK